MVAGGFPDGRWLMVDVDWWGLARWTVAEAAAGWWGGWRHISRLLNDGQWWFMRMDGWLMVDESCSGQVDHVISWPTLRTGIVNANWMFDGSRIRTISLGWQNRKRQAGTSTTRAAGCNLQPPWSTAGDFQRGRAPLGSWKIALRSHALKWSPTLW